MRNIALIASASRPRALLQLTANSHFRLRRPSPAEYSRWQKQDRAYEREERFKSHPDQTERQHDEPDKREKDQGQECEWPREHEQNAPTQESDQHLHNFNISSSAK